MIRLSLSRAALLLALLAALALAAACGARPTWSEADRATLRSLWLENLPPLPPDLSNAAADDPRAAGLGRALFFDARLSGDGSIACATCHQPELAFTDGKPLAQGMGAFTRNTMPLAGASYSQWFTWDGKADSQWMQALLPLENQAEHGTNRMAVAHLVAQVYAAEYEAIFGPLPPLADGARFPARAGPFADAAGQAAWQAMAAEDRAAANRVFANVGKALAAYERTLLPAPSRFDLYVSALEGGEAGQTHLNKDEVAGLRLFMGKARCTECHNGPLFTNFEFHNTAVPPVAGLPVDRGRAAALDSLTASEFNCQGPYSDAAPEACGGLRFLKAEGETLEGGFRTPTLRDLALTAPYMHAGQFAALADVLRHYNEGGLELLGHNELSPLGLNDRELAQLEAFLLTLSPSR